MKDVRKSAKFRREEIARIRREAPKKGVAFFILYTVLMSSNNYVAKAIFEIYPSLDVWQMTFARGLIAFIMMMLKINTKAKQELWDGIDRPSLPSLVFRCF